MTAKHFDCHCRLFSGKDEHNPMSPVASRQSPCMYSNIIQRCVKLPGSCGHCSLPLYSGGTQHFRIDSAWSGTDACSAISIYYSFEDGLCIRCLVNMPCATLAPVVAEYVCGFAQRASCTDISIGYSFVGICMYMESARDLERILFRLSSADLSFRGAMRCTCRWKMSARRCCG